MKTSLPTVTLLGIDCVDIARLVQAADICQKDFEFGAVKLLTSLPTDNRHSVPIRHIGFVEEYSRFAISELDRYVDTEHVLLIQHDGFILNPDAWTDEYLEYDYIGAPWLVTDWSIRNFGFPKDSLGTLVVGNGGFCLRSKRLLSTLAEMSAERVITEFHPEDVVICVRHRKELERRGVRFAPVELARRFSFEAEDDTHNQWTDQFGFHGLRWTDISLWLEQHPEYTIDNTLDRDRADSRDRRDS